MIYLFYGDDRYTINTDIDKIIKDNKIDNINVSRYNYNECSYKEIIKDITTISLFDDKKVVIVDNANIFKTKDKNIDKDIEDEEEFLRYLKNPNNNTILIFISDKVNINKKIFKEVKKTGIVVVYNEEKNIYLLAKKLFDNYKISDEDINYLISLISNDTYRLHNEIDKLKMYKVNELLITRNDIDELVFYMEEADYNKLVASIINNDKDCAISIYKEFIKRKEEPLVILLGIAKRIRLMYQVKNLISRGYTNDEIATILGEKSGYIYYVSKDASLYSSKELLDYISLFADKDYEAKIGKINIGDWLEVFILTK